MLKGSVPRKIWTVNIVFPTVNKKQPFSRPSLSKTIILSHWSFVCQETWTMNVQDFLCILVTMFQIMPLFTLEHKLGYHNYKHEPNSHYTMWTYSPNIFVHIYQNTTNCNSYFKHYHQICARNIPLKCHICQLLHVQIEENYVSIYNSHESMAIKNETRSTGICTFNIIGICPWKNMPATSHMYVPMD